MKCNNSLEEQRALQELRKNDIIKILPVAKWQACLILDTTECNNKIVTLLQGNKTLIIKQQPNKYQLIKILKEWQDQGKIINGLSRKLYPTTETPPRFYGLPKIHKEETPHRPIVITIDSITHNILQLS